MTPDQLSDRSDGVDLDLDAVQAAIEAIDAHFPTSAAYGLLSEAVPDGIRAYLSSLASDETLASGEEDTE